MSVFLELQAEHQTLLAQQSDFRPPVDSSEELSSSVKEQELLEQVQEYIRRVRQESHQVASPHERDQLRANIRYWSGYVFEQTGTYPNTELAPASDLAPDNTGLLRAPLIIAGLVILLIIALGAAVFGLMNNNAAEIAATQTRNSEIEATNESATQTVGAIQTEVTPLTETPTLVNTSTSTPSSTPSLTPTSTATATATPMPTPTETPTPALPGLFAQLIYPEDGTEVQPRTTLTGTFMLRESWSIHVLLQPFSQGRVWVPVPDFFQVPEGQSSGTWSLEVNFGEGAELESPEQYRIQIVVANNDQTRELLERSVETGFQEIPNELIPYAPVTTVFRRAYHEINEIRVVYSAGTGLELPDIVTIRPDGSDFRQITFTPLVGERDPSLSPDGRKIVYVRWDPIDNFTNVEQSLWMMDSDGQNQTLLVRESGMEYERPFWSPDGRYIAYSIPNRRQIFIYDVMTKENSSVADGRFPSWLPDGSGVVYNGRDFNLHQLTFDQIGDTLELISPIETQLTDNPDTNDTHPAVSPDGNMVAFTSALSNSLEIRILDLQTLEVRSLTSGLSHQFPSWHPDGQEVFFESFADLMWSIWVVTIDGNNLRVITSEDSLQSFRPYLGFMEAFLPLDP
jgi:hypothetical protein